MNDKYISVLKFKQSLAKLTVEGGDKTYAEAIARTLSEVVPHLLDDSPAADVQSVKRGKWEKDEKRNSFEKFCSVCKHEAYWDTDYGQQLFDYCPNCGADMRDEDNE